MEASGRHVKLFSCRPSPESVNIRAMDELLLSDNIAKLLQRVRRSAQKSQYRNSDILVVAVSKTRPAQDIRAAHACGLINFGESYLQEALQKITELQDLPLVWHFVGPIQSNKTGPIAEHFDWVHSIDREKIARRLMSSGRRTCRLYRCVYRSISRGKTANPAYVSKICRSWRAQSLHYRT